MEPVGVLHAVARPASLALISLVALTAASCTRLLGIDGDYVTATGVAGGVAGGDRGGGDGGGATPVGTGAGAAEPPPAAAGGGGGGGAGGSGGAPLGGSAGAPVEAGPVPDVTSAGGRAADASPPTDSGTGCRPGRYSGTLTGTHSPAVPIVVGQINITTFEVRGTLWMVLHGSGSTLQFDASDSAVAASLYLPGGPAAVGQFSGSLSGSFDCRAHRVDATLSGELGGSGFTAVRYAGTLTGSESGGGWAEHEVLVQPSKGSGSWTLSYQSP